MRLLTAIGVTVLATGMSASLAQAQNLPDNIESRQFRLELISSNQLRLAGSVRLTSDDGAWEFHADQVDFFTDESRLVATGNVVFISADGRIAAERVEFNTETETGTFYNVSVKGTPAGIGLLSARPFVVGAMSRVAPPDPTLPTAGR
jgi:lipopolysaccharide assembly outer membrane protein LptD (OstA)|tara:strand:- start:574 stop:1017 length:444 start_codon:yes stop_codon:yes gene_type:complete